MLENDKKGKIEGQIGLFDLGSALAKAVEPTPPDVKEFPEKQRLAMEKETTGLYMSGHPMTEHQRLAQKLGSAKTSDIVSSSVSEIDSPYKDGEKVRLLGILATVRKKITKNDTTMAFLTMEDIYGSVEVLVFPKKFDTYGQFFIEDEIVLLTGKVSLRDDEIPKLLCEEVVPLSEIPDDDAYLQNYKLPDADYKLRQSAYTAYNVSAPKNENAAVKSSAGTEQKKSNRGLFLRVSSENAQDAVRASRMCSIFEGNIPVILYYQDTKQYNFSTGILTQNNPELIGGLKKLLGENNVVLKI